MCYFFYKRVESSLIVFRKFYINPEIKDAGYDLFALEPCGGVVLLMIWSFYWIGVLL
ncbi:unnamed protein product [Tenebrio molitor]|nr:unnamed protein product [Tenebrio molitor]